MCDKDHFDDDLKEYTARGAVTRREFGALTLGAGMAFLLPRAADAVAVTESEVKIKTPDGTCDAYFVHPASGAAPAVIVWPDILGLRPAFRQMGKRLAESGYSVLVVNPFYRMKAAPVVPDGAKFSRSGEPQYRDATRRGAERRPRTSPMRRRSSRGSTARLPSTSARRSARWATAWAARSRCGPRPRCRIASAPALIPRRRARHQGSEQPAPARRRDEGAVPDSRSPTTTTSAIRRRRRSSRTRSRRPRCPRRSRSTRPRTAGARRT